jgi:hypothetical protein
VHLLETHRQDLSVIAHTLATAGCARNDLPDGVRAVHLPNE